MQHQFYTADHYRTFRELLNRTCDRYGDSILFETFQEKISYKDFYQIVCNGVNNLLAYHDALIAIEINRTDVFAMALFAVVISGNTACLHRNTDIKPACVITEDIVRKWQSEIWNEGRIIPDCEEEDIIAAEERRAAVILCSSGTTAEPKGICLSQRNLCSCTEAGIRVLSYPIGCRYLSILPMQHAFGIVGDLLGAIFTGGTLCLLDSPLQFFRGIQVYQPQAMHLPPEGAARLGAYLKTIPDPMAFTGGQLKLIMCAGAPLFQETVDTLAEFGILAVAAYGLTECGPCVSMNSDLLYRQGSCGHILSNNQVRISEEGEILVKGDGVMLGYYQDPELTAETIVDGWLHTGDLGYLDEDEFLYITGRKKNLLIFQDGTKLVPELLESKLNGLEGVQECLISGIDNGLYIVICLREDSCSDKSKEELLDRIQKLAQEKSRHKVVKLEISEEPLKRNKSGKLIRR